MPREYKARDKKFNKMTRDGLIEKNAATGEIENISKREQDFSLRKETPNSQDSLVKNGRTGYISGQTDKNESLRKQQSTQDYRTPKQTVEPKQNSQNGAGDISPPSSNTPESVKHDLSENRNRHTDSTVQTENYIPENPAEAVKPIEHSHTSPAGTPPGRSDADAPLKYPHETTQIPPKTETAESHGRLRFTQDPPQTQSDTEHQLNEFTQSETPITPKAPQSDKLQFSRDTKINHSSVKKNSRKSKKKLQKGNKYQQRFTPEAAQVENASVLEYRQTEQTAQPDEKPEVINNITPETPVTPTIPHSPQTGKNGKLQFVKDNVLNQSRKGKKPRKKGNKYQQQKPDEVSGGSQSRSHTAKIRSFTPEAAKTQPQTFSESAKPNSTPFKDSGKTDSTPVVNDLSNPEKAELRQDNKQSPKPETSQADNQSHKSEISQAEKKPVSNEVQPEKTQLRTDPKPTKLQEKTGKLKFDTDNPVKDRKKPPRKSKRKRLGDEKSVDKKPVSDVKEPTPDKPNKDKPPSSRRDRPTEPRVSQRDGNKGKLETPKKVDKSSKLKFTDDEKSAPSDKKLIQLQDKADKYNTKLDKAREKLPSKKSLKAVRTIEDGKSKAKTRLKFEKEILPPGARKSVHAPATFAKKGTDSLTHLGKGKLHQKVYEVENENVGVEAGHRVEQAAESVYRSGKRATRSAFRYVRNKPYRTVEKLEKKAVQANIKYSYRKALSENPQLKSNVMSRFMQKRKIKKQYAKAARDAKRAKNTAKKTGDMAAKAVKAVVGAIKNHPVVVVTIVIVLLLIFFVASFLSALGGLAGSGLPAFVASTYLADDASINQSELSYTEWETDLQIQILNTETDYPGYDEYRYSIGGIGHNPNELMAYLTAMYGEFQYVDIETVLQQIFNEQYQLVFTPSVETRYYLDEDDNPVPYDWNVLTVTLTSRSFTEVVFPNMNSEQTGIYGLLTMSGGNRQHTGSPFSFNWLSSVTSNYGYRVHPITGVKDYHMGIDIAVPIGTDIQSAQDGTVTYAGYNGGYGYVVVIEDANGLVTKYAHCDSLLVSVGQEVKSGDMIAKSGNTGDSTGPHLHFEVIKDGQYLNPYYFAATGASAW